MQHTTRGKATVVALLLLLTASLVANVILYRGASRPLFEEDDRPLIERTAAHFARARGNENIRSETFPIVMRWPDRTCVELRRYDRLGHAGTCYDRRGRMMVEAESVVG